MRTVSPKYKYIRVLLIICYFFISAIYVCSLVTKKDAKYNNDYYGISADDEVYFNNEHPLTFKFKTTKDNFYGLSVRSSESNYTEGKIIAKFYANKKYLGKAEADLSKEYSSAIGHYMAFYPDIDIASGKEITVKFTTEGLKHNTVSFDVSEKKDSKSVLKIGESLKTKALVCQALYEDGYDNNIATLIGQAVLLLLLGIWLWFCVLRRLPYPVRNNISDEETLSDISHSKRHRHKKWKIKNIFFAVLTMMIVFIVGVFIYKSFVEDGTELLRREALVSSNKNYSKHIVLCDENQYVSQTIPCSWDDLKLIKLGEFRISDKSLSTKDSKLYVTIYNKTTGKNIYSKKYTVSNFLKRHKSKRIYIKLKESEWKKINQNDTLTIKIRLSNPHKTRIVLGAQASLPEYNSTIESENGTSNGYTMIQKVFYSDYKILRNAYWILVAILSLIALEIYVVCIMSSMPVEKKFLWLAIPLGIVMGLVITVYGVPDENVHIDTAYAYSNKLLLIGEPEHTSYMYKRSCDADIQEEQKTFVTEDSYLSLIEGFQKPESTKLTEVYCKNSSSNGGFFFYFPGAIGITLGRLLGLNFMPTMLLGRLFMLLSYIALVYLGIKKLPYGKELMLMIAILPIALQQGASFSYDALGNGYVFAFVGICIKLAFEESDILISDWIGMLFTGIMIALYKGGAYSAILLMLPWVLVRRKHCFGRRKKLFRREFKYLLTMFILIIGFLCQKQVVSMISRFISSNASARTNPISGKELFSISYLISHPLRFIKIIVASCDMRGDIWIKNLFGGTFSRTTSLQTQWFFVIAIIILLYEALRNNSEFIHKITKWDRIYILFIAFMGYFLINLSMLLVDTSITNKYIEGIQGRYYLPYIIGVLLLGMIYSKEKHFWKSRRLIFSMGFIDCMILLRIVEHVFL